MYTVKAILILDNDGDRLFAKVSMGWLCQGLRDGAQGWRRLGAPVPGRDTGCT